MQTMQAGGPKSTQPRTASGVIQTYRQARPEGAKAYSMSAFASSGRIVFFIRLTQDIALGDEQIASMGRIAGIMSRPLSLGPSA